MENDKMKAIAQSILIIGIIVIISFLASYISFFLLLALVVLPILITIIYYKSGLKYAITSIVISTILNSAIIDPITGIIIGLCCSIVGLTLGYSIKLKNKHTRTLILLTVAFIVFYFSSMWIMGIFMGSYNPIKVFSDDISQLSRIFMDIIEEAKSAAMSIGTAAADMEVFEYLKIIFSKEMLSATIPASMILVSFIQGYICFAIFEYFIKRIDDKYISKLDLSEVYISNLLGAALIASTSICIILINKDIQGIDAIYNFVSIITKYVLCINGVCAIEYYLKRKMAIQRFPRAAIIVVTFILSSGLIYSFIGIGEMLLDFRKLDPHRIRKA